MVYQEECVGITLAGHRAAERVAGTHVCIHWTVPQPSKEEMHDIESNTRMSQGIRTGHPIGPQHSNTTMNKRT